MEELERLAQLRDEAGEELRSCKGVLSAYIRTRPQATDEEREIAANMMSYWASQQCGAD